MLQIMIILFIFAGKYSHYKAECSSYHAENTFLCMRQNPRGLTPSETGMDDRQKDEKGQKSISLRISWNKSIVITCARDDSN